MFSFKMSEYAAFSYPDLVVVVVMVVIIQRYTQILNAQLDEFYACIYRRLYHSYQDVEHSSVSEVFFYYVPSPTPVRLRGPHSKGDTVDSLSGLTNFIVHLSQIYIVSGSRA